MPPTSEAKNHTNDVAEFRGESPAKNEGVKNFAAQTLPTLQNHLLQPRALPKQKREPRNDTKGKPSPGKLQQHRAC